MAYITTDPPTVSKDVEEVVYFSKYHQYIYPRSIASIYAYTSLSILPNQYLSFSFLARTLYISNLFLYILPAVISLLAEGRQNSAEWLEKTNERSDGGCGALWGQWTGQENPRGVR